MFIKLTISDEYGRHGESFAINVNAIESIKGGATGGSLIFEIGSVNSYYRVAESLDEILQKIEDALK